MHQNQTRQQPQDENHYPQPVMAARLRRAIPVSSDHRQQGFSLVELLIVIACIGIIATIAIPRMRSAMDDARQSAALQNLRGIVAAQHNYNIQNRRFARLSELSVFSNNQFGTLSTQTLTKSFYTFNTVPVTPSDTQLSTAFTVTGTTVLPDGSVIQFQADQGGGITQTLP